jgi:beta-lactam-binding protein with PASTA domain
VTSETFSGGDAGLYVLTAADALQFAWDGSQLRAGNEAADGFSQFTSWLVDGLEKGEAAPDDEQITMDALYRYLFRRARAEGMATTPQRFVQGGVGDIVISRNPSAGTAQLDPATLKALAAEDWRTRLGAVAELTLLLRGESAAARAARLLLERQLQHERDHGVWTAITAALRGIAPAETSTAAAEPDRHASKPVALASRDEVATRDAPAVRPAAEARFAPSGVTEVSSAGSLPRGQVDHGMRHRTSRLVLAGGASLALVIAFLVYFFWPWVYVPDVVGQPEAKAKATLEQIGFHWQKREEPSVTAVPGTVVGTVPAAGQIVDKGAPLTVVTAVPRPVPRPEAQVSGPPVINRPLMMTPLAVPPVKVGVPSVIGQPEAEAAAAVERIGLKWQRQEEPSGTSAGTVIRTSPAPGELVAKGQAVTAAVAVPIKVSVPPVSGQPESEAAAALSRLGLNWQKQEQQSEGGVGSVIATSPPIGQAVDKGSTVTLIVGVPVSVAVPPTAGQTVAEATAALVRAGFKWQRQDQPSDSTLSGRVINSSPSAGELADKGATVTLTVAAPIRVAVPSVVGQPAASAIAALVHAGFKARRQDEPSEKVAPGRVISASPATGQLVDKGSTITLVVAKTIRVQPVAKRAESVATYSNASESASPATGTGRTAVAPWGQTPPYPGNAAATAAPQAPVSPPLDPLISHLYDNAHR